MHIRILAVGLALTALPATAQPGASPAGRRLSGPRSPGITRGASPSRWTGAARTASQASWAGTWDRCEARRAATPRLRAPRRRRPKPRCHPRFRPRNPGPQSHERRAWKRGGGGTAAGRMRDVLARRRHGRRGQACAGTHRRARHRSGARCGRRAGAERHAAARPAHGGRGRRGRVAQESRVARAVGRAGARRSGPRAGGTVAQSGVRVLEQAQRRRHADRPGLPRQRRGARDDAARARDRGAPVRAVEARSRGGDRRDRRAVRQAYVRAVAAQEMAAYAAQVVLSAEASSELARRMQQVGNWSRLAQMREQAYYAEATAQLARAQQAAVAEREQLTRLLGLTGADVAFELPAHLPDVPASPFAPVDAERAAMERRLDVQVAKLDAEGVAKTLGLTRATRFVNVLEVGYTNESETGDARKNGYEIELRAAAIRLGRSAHRARRASAIGRRWHARRKSRSARASEVRESVRRPTALPTTWPSTTATRSCRCASASQRKTCCATTAC